MSLAVIESRSFPRYQAVSELKMSAFKYNFAVVSRIPDSFTTRCKGENLDLTEARKKHYDLVETLRNMQLDVLELPPDERHPEGVFVEDIAVVINGTALICNPADSTRQGEVDTVRQVLRKELKLKIVEIEDQKAYVEGGDVLFTGKEIFVGISKFTNAGGAQAVARAFPEYSTCAIKVFGPNHLKDYMSMAGPDIIAISNSDDAQKTFKDMQYHASYGSELIHVESNRAANVIFANGHMCHISSDDVRGVGVYENKINYDRKVVAFKEMLKATNRLSSSVLLVSKIRHPKKITSTLQ
ncbi:unnamed protein product [Owenia fusiformis]|uniref:Dimethylargininase n=1 Tax=Owenia fusiformis TaxID=6347 RepID=A0A8S4P441_OWEFU|nr:unnamed protein product [Owenia fusiformis]